MGYSVSAEIDGQLRRYPFDTLKEAAAFARDCKSDGSNVPVIKVNGRMIESPEELAAMLQEEAAGTGR